MTQEEAVKRLRPHIRMLAALLEEPLYTSERWGRLILREWMALGAIWEETWEELPLPSGEEGE